MLAGDTRNLSEAEFVGAFGKGAERKVWLVVETCKGGDGLVGELLGVIRSSSILPEQFGQLPPAERASALAVAEVAAIPDSQIALLVRTRVGGREVEGAGGVAENLVGLYEDRGAQLYGIQGVIVDVYCEGASADVTRLLEDGDIKRDAGLLGIPAEVVGGRRPGSTGACAKDIWVSVELLPGHADT